MTTSLRTRLTLWYTLTLFVVLGLFAAALLWQQERVGLRRVDRELAALGAAATSVIRDEFREQPDPRAAALDVLETFETPNRLLVIADDHGRVLAEHWNELEPQPIQPLAEKAQRTWSVSGTRGAWRLHAQGERLGSTALAIVVGMPLGDIQREQLEARKAMTIGVPIALLLAAIGGMWLATIGLRPITEMATRAAQIPPTGEEDLGRPLRNDELGRLTLAFNGLVGRLRDALATQRQFMADASHELRTPVSVIHTTADVTLSRERRDEAEYRDAVMVMSGEAGRLGRLVDDMLILARADAGAYPMRLVDLYLDEIVAECARALDVVARRRGVCIVIHPLPEMELRGDEDLLRRLVMNVLQNAVQHTRHNGEVIVTADASPDRVSIRVTDGGAGVAAADRERIFHRFVQLDPSRRSEGVGLGLSIARWIASAHHGTLSLEASGPGGSTFCVSLPVSADQPQTTSNRSVSFHPGTPTIRNSSR
jgi:heavy metal sensor kinase